MRPARSMNTDVGTVHHDFGDVLVLQQAIDRAVAEDVVGDVLDQLRLVGGRQRRPLLRQRGMELLVDATAQVVLGQPLVVEDRAELVDQMVVDLLPELVEHRIARDDCPVAPPPCTSCRRL